jgi:hypothetical protein
VYRPPSRRGITLTETCVACTLGTLLVYLVAMSGIEFTRSARLIAARADLMREADIAVAYLVDSLHTQGQPPTTLDGGGVRIGDHTYSTHAGRLRRTVAGIPDDHDIAWHVESIQLAGTALTLTLSRPDLVENRRTGQTLERTLDVLVVAP